MLRLSKTIYGVASFITDPTTTSSTDVSEREKIKLIGRKKITCDM